jgi:hypothetical protein
MQVRVEAGLGACKLGGKCANGTRLYQELREWTHPSGTPGDAEEQEANAFTNASVRYFHCPRLYSFLFTWDMIEWSAVVAP